MTLVPHLAIAAGIIPGGPELIIILLIVVLLFGATKLPQLAKGIGQSIKEFKKASADEPKDEPTPEELKAQLAATKAELAAKNAKASESSKPGHN
jgi:sec-independent protein translocase protein TatA